MPRSLKVRQECIERVKQSVARNGFSSQRALAEDVGMALATVGSFLRGNPVDRAVFVELCDKLSLDCQEISEQIQERLLRDKESSPASSLTHLSNHQNPNHQNPSHQDTLRTNISWGEAIDVSAFQGRKAELSILRRWVVDDHCRLIILTGMGGIGKTALSVRLAAD